MWQFNSPSRDIKCPVSGFVEMLMGEVLLETHLEIDKMVEMNKCVRNDS